jgi:hypothetical protein
MIRGFVVVALLLFATVGMVKAEPAWSHDPYRWYDGGYNTHHGRDWHKERRHEQKQFWAWCRSHDYRPHNCR